MSFTIDEKTFMISGYKGDSLSLTFKFETDFSDFNINFFIKKHINDTEEDAVIVKEYNCPVNKTVNLVLTPEETAALGTNNCCYRDYYWSLKIKSQGTFVKTLIPENFDINPVFRVFP